MHIGFKSRSGMIRLVSCLLIFGATIEIQAATTAIVAATIIDGHSDRPRKNLAIIVDDDRISAIVPVAAIPAGAQIIDLGTATVLPGLIDAHSHPLIASDDYQNKHLQHSSAYKAVRGLHALQANLRAGWTSIRVAGDADVAYAVMDIRKAIDDGLFTGPRLFGAGHYISITGGGGDINYMSHEQNIVADGLVADGVDEMRKAVRQEIKFGSDWIKILVTGAFMSAGDSPMDVHFSPEELQVAIQEATRLGVPVMAHAHAAEGIKQAVRAGVRSIEHGSFIDAEGIKLMRQRGTFLVPTMYIGDYYINEKADSVAQAKMVELSRKTRADFFQRISDAIKAGVKVVVGSDFGGYDPQLNAREFAVLIEAGMSPMQAIKAGTSLNAELLQREDDLGSLQSGYYADIIAVAGNPLDDISELERVIFVMKGGAVIKMPENDQQ